MTTNTRKIKNHILLVDDEPYFRFAVSIVLKRAGFKVTEAKDGEEALLKIRKDHQKDPSFDLILLDIQMPKVSGMELMEELKRNDISIPIFIISGVAEKEELKSRLSKECISILFKPLKPEELVREIDTFLESGNYLTRDDG